MSDRKEFFLAFLAGYAVYPALAGLWLAYLAGTAPWIGAVIGLALAILVGLPTRWLRRQGVRRTKSRNRLKELLDG